MAARNTRKKKKPKNPHLSFLINLEKDRTASQANGD